MGLALAVTSALPLFELEWPYGRRCSDAGRDGLCRHALALDLQSQGSSALHSFRLVRICKGSGPNPKA